jgi:23S rRNA (uridine2552-2'-O)-methyltransferase
VHFIQGDFREDADPANDWWRRSMAVSVDLVLSDMAPNMSGIAAVDQARVMLPANGTE